MKQEMVHATAVAIGGCGILLTGPSGSGKSDLALRIIDRGAILVSDDVVIVSRYDRGLLLRAAPNIAGKIEVRGVGICTIPHLCSAPLQLVVVLSNDVERMPDESRTATMMGIDVPSIELAAFEGSAAIKVELALKRLTDAPNAPLIARFCGVSESPEL